MKPSVPKRMLFIGEQWFGANSRSLSSAFRRRGWIVDEIDPADYVPASTTLSSRIARRALTPIFRSGFNAAILRNAQALRPTIVLVYKGNYVHAATLDVLSKQGILLALYYPDVSLYTHGPDIPRCIPKYDIVFTAKSFGIADLKVLGASNGHLVLHGFDPEVHRKLREEVLPAEFQCDASFIGTWSAKKEQILADLIASVPDLSLKVWGAQWSRASSRPLSRHIMHQHVVGDSYAAAIQSSSINLGLLSEARVGASSGDLTTARTFEIPACGGFMLHERTDELLKCFKEDVEVACFSTLTELIDKVKYYLNHEADRKAIASCGYERCVAEHSYDHRASAIVEILNAL